MSIFNVIMLITFILIMGFLFFSLIGFSFYYIKILYTLKKIEKRFKEQSLRLESFKR